MGKEKFSVLLSLYKSENPEYLKQALDSILGQTILPDEIVIVRDGPITSELEVVLKEYCNKSDLFRIIPFSVNRGLGLALRDGVEACKYELIARMDTDDVCELDRFEKQLQYLKQNPDVALLGTAIDEFSEDINNPDSILVLPSKHNDIVNFAKFRNPFKHPTVFFKKSAVIASGNYRHFLWFEDYDLFVRMIKFGFVTANLPNVLVHVRANQEQFARRGGLEYAKKDYEFEKFLYRLHLIGRLEFYRNVLMRVLVRILPNNLRTFLYRIILRS